MAMTPDDFARAHKRIGGIQAAVSTAMGLGRSGFVKGESYVWEEGKVGHVTPSCHVTWEEGKVHAVSRGPLWSRDPLSPCRCWSGSLDPLGPCRSDPPSPCAPPR